MDFETVLNAYDKANTDYLKPRQRAMAWVIYQLPRRQRQAVRFRAWLLRHEEEQRELIESLDRLAKITAKWFLDEQKTVLTINEIEAIVNYAAKTALTKQLER